ncbi:hypothetical protein AB1Y20_013927 [Prymnesium parvum]|uniref:Uncharacterized protein n=1 Tax=Prymnesium parvum TaxID=97485 RepID=A0AB34IHE8_PRYPA
MKGGACLQRLGGADIFVTEKGEERVQALLRMSRASGVGLKNALSRLEIEREAGRRQLEASRSRERKLRQDLARRDELVDSGERQLQELQHALIRAQAERDQVARGSLRVHEQIACAHDLAAETARVELAEALRRRRTRTKAFQAWVEKAHASVLLLLSSRLAIQSASLHAFRRWRRHTPVSISKMLSRVPESSRLHAKRAVPFGHEGQLLRSWKKWREWMLARANRDVAASRLRLHRSRRAIRHRFRCWRGVHRMREDSVSGRKEALRIVLRAAALTDLTDAVLMWRLATAAWLAEAQVTPKLRSSAERQLDDLRASSIAALRRSEAEARGLRAELSEEQRRLIDALESQKQVINASEQTEKMLHAQKSALVTTIADADSLVSTLSEACQAASRAAQREQRKASAELHASVGQALADGRSAVEAERTKTLVAHAEVKAVVMALHEADVTTAEWQAAQSCRTSECGSFCLLAPSCLQRATAQRAHQEISKREERLLELSQQLEEARAVAVERQAAMQQLKESDAERLKAAEARAREAEDLQAELAAQRTTLLAQLSELEEESFAARGVLGARQKEVETLQQSLSQQVMATDALKSDFTARLESAQVALRDAIEEASRREARQAEAASMLRRQAEQAKREMEATLKQAAVERALAVEANLADFEAAFRVGLGLPPPDEEARTAGTGPVPQGRAEQVLALVSRREASLRQLASSLNDEHTAREAAMASELERARNAAAVEAAENSRAMAAAAQELQQSEAARAKAEEGREEAESLTRMAVATCKASDNAREAAEEARRIAETAHATIQASLHECEQEIAQAESAHAIAVVDTAIQLEQMKVVIEEVERELEEVREERLRVRELWTRAEEALRAAETGRAEAEVAVARVMEAHTAGMAEVSRLHTEKQEVEVALKSALAQQMDIQASHEEAHAEKMSSLEAELLQASEREVKLQAAGSAMQSALRAASAREAELHATILELRQSISRHQEELEVCRRDAEASETQKLSELRASHEASVAAMKAAAADRASEQKEVNASLEARLEKLSGEHQLAEARLVENTQASLDLVEQLKSATASCRDESTRRKSLEAQLLQASADLEVARARAALLESAVDSAEARAADGGRRAARAEGDAAALETQIVAQEMVYAAVTSSVQSAVQDQAVTTDVVRRTVQAEIAAQDAIRAALEKQLAEKDTAIQDMSVQLEENERKAESRVTLLKASLDELRAAQALLEGKLAEQREARGALEVQLQAKDNAVQVLSAKLSHEVSSQSRSAALKEQLEELRAAQVLLEGQLTEQRQARGELEIQLEAKENAVQVLSAELSKEENTKGMVESLNATLEELRTARTVLEGKLADQLQARASLEAQLVEKENAIQVLSMQVEESERNAGGRVATLKATLEELRASQALLEGRLAEQREARGALEEQLQERERAIQDLGIQLKENEQSAESRVTSLKATLQEFRAAQALFDGQLAEQRKARGALEAQLEELRAAKALLEGKLTEQLQARASLEAKLEEKENVVAVLSANSLEQLDSADRKVSLMKKALQDHQMAQASLAQNLAEAHTSRVALEARLQEEVSARTNCEVKIQDLSKECLILRARSNELIQILNAVKSECKKAEDAVVERVAVVERHAAERETAHTRTLTQATETLVACLRDEILKLEKEVSMSESATLSATEQAATAASEALAHMQAAQVANTSREAAAVAQSTAEAALLSAQRELELFSARAKNAEHARDEALRAAQMAASGREEAELRASAESQRVQTALQRCEAVELASKHQEILLKEEIATVRADLAEQKVLLETRVEELLTEREGVTAELDAVRRAATELNATSYAVEAELRTAREVAEVKVQHAEHTTAMEIATGQRKEHLLREEISSLESELEASRAATTSATLDAASREAALRSAARIDLAQAISTAESREAEIRATLEQTWVEERRKLTRRATELLAERDSLQAKVQLLSIKESEAAAEREAERETLLAEFTEYADREQQMRETIKKMSDSMRERELQAQKAVATAVKAVRESFLRDQEMVLAKAEAHVQVERAVGKELVAAKSAEIEASVLLGHLQRRLRRRARLWLRWTARLCQSCHAGDVARRRRAFQRLRLGSVHMHAERCRQRLASKSVLVRFSVISKTFLHFWRDAALRSVCACRHLSAATAFNQQQMTKSALSSWRELHCKYVSFRACGRAVVSTSHQRGVIGSYRERLYVRGLVTELCCYDFWMPLVDGCRAPLC